MICPIGCPMQSQIFAIQALEHIVATEGGIFTWGRAQFEMRWARLREVSKP